MKRILLDIDDVLLSWRDGFLKYADEVLKLQFASSNLFDESGWNGMTKIEIDQTIQNFCDSPEYFSNIPPVAGAVKNVKKLANDGWTFVAITASHDSESSTKSRQKNLFDVFGSDVFEDIHMVGVGKPNSKKPVLKRYNPTYWIEDNPYHAVDGHDVGHTTLIFDCLHNRDLAHPGIKRVFNWDEIYYYISSNYGR